MTSGGETQTGRRKIEIGVISALCATMVVTILNSAQLGPFIPDIADDLSRSVPVIGQAATVFLVMSALGGLLAGPLADHYGHRRALFLGLTLTAISAGAGGLAPNYLVLLLTRMLGGFGTAATIGIVFAMASTRYAGEGRLRALSIVSGSFSMAPIVGIPLLTTLSIWIAWRGAWLFVALLAVAVIVMLLVLAPVDGPRPAERFTVRGAVRSYGPLLRSRPMLALFGASAFQGMLFLAALTYNGAYFIEDIGISTQQFGIVAAVSGSAFALGSFAAGQLGRFDLRLLFGTSMIIASAALMLAYGLALGAVGTTALICLGFFLAGVNVVAILGLLASETPAGQATTMVINESIFSVGAALGAGIGGVVIGLAGYGGLAVVLPMFGLTGGLLIWRPLRSRRPATVRSA